jgi:hypothetical protein
MITRICRWVKAASSAGLAAVVAGALMCGSLCLGAATPIKGVTVSAIHANVPRPGHLLPDGVAVITRPPGV